MPKKAVSATPVVFPAPVAMVTCGTTARPNIITLAWVGVVCSDPPMLSIAIRPSRYSNGLVRASQEFVVNIPSAALLDQMEFCGTKSGREVDKFKACQLTPEAASVVNVPLIGECPINIECTVTQVLPLGVHDLFLGRIVAAQVDEAALDEKGALDVTRVPPMTYVMGKFYELGGRLVSSHS
jgi:flavin reductase (DIM6/NTAB) family NADH-FMN oxidoreductase RutF